jgi:hypothetical protein
VESVVVRRFERGDREQVTALANAHIAAVVPNVSVQGLLSQLEREPGEIRWLGGVTRLLDYASLDDAACRAFLAKAGFQELTRTVRGLSRAPALS